MSWLLAILGIIALIILHELGHFVAAKAVGMRVERFSLFFPPILTEFGWDRGVTAGAFSFGFIVSAFMSPLIGRLMDRAADTEVGGAAADIAGHGRVDVRIARVRVTGEECGG